MLERAHTYVSYGWHLLPLLPGGKEPHRELLHDLYGDTRTRHLREAPAIFEEVAYWLENEPLINLGVFPCEAAGLVVVDVDNCDALPVDLLTPTVVSGRPGGGRHLYFACSYEIPITKQPWGHVNPAYAVLPGSLHPSGRTYEWVGGRSLGEVALIPFEEAAAILGVESLAS
jgi:hypothetical protein